MISKIGYENKTALQNDEDVPETQKVTDQNMNEIKKVVNDNADELEEFQNSYKVVTEKEVSISPIQPLQNQTLWIQRGKNRFNKYGAFDFGVGNTSPVLQEDGTILTTQNSNQTASKQVQLFLGKNTEYKCSGKLINMEVTSGSATTITGTVIICGYDKNFTLNIVKLFSVNNIGNFDFDFNSGDYEYYGLSLTLTTATGSTGKAIYDDIMISKEGGDYEDFIEDKFLIKENNSFSEIIDIEEVRNRRFKQIFDGSVAIGSRVNLNMDPHVYNQLLIKVSNSDIYIPVAICENLKSLKGANVNTNSDNIEIFSVKLDITGWNNNQLTVSQIAKWVISASGITKDTSVNTVTEIWGRR